MIKKKGDYIYWSDGNYTCHVCNQPFSLKGKSDYDMYSFEQAVFGPNNIRTWERFVRCPSCKQLHFLNKNVVESAPYTIGEKNG